MSETKEIFVFGSNLAGRHGKGAALFAKQHHAAIQGQGAGLQGNAYGIPTKSATIKTLDLPDIEKHVADFIDFANAHPELSFRLTPIGCGLAGYQHRQIGPMFKGAPPNVVIPTEFKPYIGDQ